MVKIKYFELENVKGIKKEKFELDIIPNKPSILVAPNGFGKSSFAIGFESITLNKIKLDETNYHNGDPSNKPSISINYEDSNGSSTVYMADCNSSNICSKFDIQVINNRLKAKSTTKNFGKFSSTTSRITVDDIVLIDTIPEKKFVPYLVSIVRLSFGNNGKYYPDIKDLLKNKKALVDIDTGIDFSKFEGRQVNRSLMEIITDIQKIPDKTKDVRSEIYKTIFPKMTLITQLVDIVTIISKYNVSLEVLDKYLAAIEIIQVYRAYKADFKLAVKYATYLNHKSELEELFHCLGCTWKDIKPKEYKKKLVISFPNTHHISNGERDIITLLASLQKARRKLKKETCILIIDEVFDYLDDANLIAVQYYITQMINQFKSESKVFFPIILTHLNPVYFNNFCFKDQKIYYLNKVNHPGSHSLLKIIEKREDLTIKKNVDIHLFHYNPINKDFKEDLRALGLKYSWGETSVFYRYIDNELSKYINNDPTYDPLAVCCSVRINIEKKLYNLFTTAAKKEEFISIHGTVKKLNFAENEGMDVPDIFYLLGIIYNSTLHIRKQSSDIITPIVSKLENLTIRTMIGKISSL